MVPLEELDKVTGMDPGEMRKSGHIPPLIPEPGMVQHMYRHGELGIAWYNAHAVIFPLPIICILLLKTDNSLLHLYTFVFSQSKKILELIPKIPINKAAYYINIWPF